MARRALATVTAGSTTSSPTIRQEEICKQIIGDIAARKKCSPSMVKIDVPLHQLGISSLRGILVGVATKLGLPEPPRVNGLKCRETTIQTLAEAIWQNI